MTENGITGVLRKKGYKAEKILGAGSFGQVYLVKDSWGVYYACKTAAKPEDEALLRREAEILKEMKHPLFPGYRTLIEAENHTFLVMEYVKGISVKKAIDIWQEKGWNYIRQQALAVATALADGLLYLHDRQDPILYRDLKAEHVILCENMQVRLLDLGCACPMSLAGTSLAGTRGYGAPEQFGVPEQFGAPEQFGVPEQFGAPEQFGVSKQSVAAVQPQICQSPATDVYGLGRLLHYMLTGEDPCLPPCKKSSVRCYNRLADFRLDRLVAQCTMPDPKKRLQDMRTVKRELAAASKTGGLGCALEEVAARFAWLFSGKIWENDFVYEKNICRY